MNITRIQIVLREYSTDLVLVYTDLPSPYPEEVSQQPLIFTFNVTRATGIDYVKKNFPNIPVTTIGG